MLAETPQPQRSDSDTELAQNFQRKYRVLWDEIHKVIIGQDKVVEQLLTVLFARGHALIIGVPGLAKTLLVKTLAGTLGWGFRRIQFTPDLMPSDITGTDILQTDAQTGERFMNFVPGPIFANLILADEINRTPPKTQAALLEAMQEYTVTSAGRTYELQKPFFVVATQNPIEHEGTYPLPEAQLDRFMYSINISYPEREEELRVVDETTAGERPPVQPIFSREEVMACQDLVRRVPVSRHVLEYAVDLARTSRPNDSKGSSSYVKQYVEWGAGPRASQYMILAAKTLALMRGFPTPSCEEIREVSLPVLQHRVIPNYNATGDGIDAAKVVQHLTEVVKEADYKAYQTA